jgi:hypothetical protein
MSICEIPQNFREKFVTAPPLFLSSIHERGALVALKNKKQTKQ